MKKAIKLLGLLMAMLVIVASFAACGGSETDLDYVRDKGTLVIGITEYEPMDYKENGEWVGFDAEFAKLVAEKLGVKAEFIEIDWDNKYFELKSKAIDCIWNGLTITDEAKANASISDAYVKNAQVVVMKKDALEAYTDAASIKDLKISVEKGSAGDKIAAEIGATNVTAVDYQSTALMEVNSGAADACIIDITMAKAMTGEGTSYSELGFALELSTEEYGIAFRTGSDLTEKVNEIMADLKKDGTLKALAEKYSLNITD